jgi:hypothetical protein
MYSIISPVLRLNFATVFGVFFLIVSIIKGSRISSLIVSGCTHLKVALECKNNMFARSWTLTAPYLGWRTGVVPCRLSPYGT